jgi:MYXO-CTERM domain-containing protein
VDAGADLGSTIAWAGITNLKDANGNAITDFSAVSTTSGFDYRKGYVSAVPLPPSAALLATAVAGLAAWRQRRRRGLR